MTVRVREERRRTEYVFFGGGGGEGGEWSVKAGAEESYVRSYTVLPYILFTWGDDAVWSSDGRCRPCVVPKCRQQCK